MRRAIVAVGHYSAYALALVALPFVAVTFVVAPGVPGTCAVLLYVALFACYVAHDGRLCLRCAQTVPVNGPAVAERRDRALRAVHHIRRRLPWYVAAFFAALAARVVSAVFVEWPRAAGGVFLLAVVVAPVSVTILLSTRHDRIQPWCPYCRWGGGDDGPEEFAPDGPDDGRHRVAS